jgi:hypothetical protein
MSVIQQRFYTVGERRVNVCVGHTWSEICHTISVNTGMETIKYNEEKY